MCVAAIFLKNSSVILFFFSFAFFLCVCVAAGCLFPNFLNDARLLLSFAPFQLLLAGLLRYSREKNQKNFHPLEFSDEYLEIQMTNDVRDSTEWRRRPKQLPYPDKKANI